MPRLFAIRKRDTIYTCLKQKISQRENTDRYVIAHEMKNTRGESQHHYFSIVFMDSSVDRTNIEEPVAKRTMKNGILMLDDQGDLSILDELYQPMRTNSHFVFRDEMLELMVAGIATESHHCCCMIQ